MTSAASANSPLVILLYMQAWKQSGEAKLHRRLAEYEEERVKLASPPGRKRDSSIAGFCDGALRHTDGSYTCAWEAQNPFGVPKRHVKPIRRRLTFSRGHRFQESGLQLNVFLWWPGVHSRKSVSWLRIPPNQLWTMEVIGRTGCHSK
jgi:hypothetical protein